MNVLKGSLFFLVFIVCVNLSFSFNICGVDYQEPWFNVTDSSNVDVLLVDNQGDVYIRGEDHSSINNLIYDSFNVFGIFFNTVTSYFNTNLFYEKSNIPSSSNGLYIESNLGQKVALFDNTGKIYSKGAAAFQGSQANCQSDGNYCSGSLLENRNYFCDIIGDKSGSCTYDVLSSIDCLALNSIDTDGGKVFTIYGAVTDYDGCSGSSCTTTVYPDSCIDSENLNEKYASSNLVLNENRNCDAASYNFCVGSDEVWRTDWLCSIGKCVQTTNKFVKDCTVSQSVVPTSWSCISSTQRQRTVTYYSPTCTGAGICGVSSTSVLETENAPANSYCSAGSFIAYTYSWIFGSWSSCSASCSAFDCGIKYGSISRSLCCYRNDGVLSSIGSCPAPSGVTSSSCSVYCGSCWGY